jgi:uncharacterized membrane protein YbhN (UPF0104 family)
VNPQLNKKLKLIVFVCIIFLFSCLLYFRWEVVRDALAAHYLVVIYATVLSIIAIALQALNFLQLLDSPSKPQFLSMYRIWALSNLANYLAPFQPGLAVRLISLRQLGVSAWMTTHATVRQLQLSIWAAVGLFSLAGIFNQILLIKIMAVISAFVFVLWPILLRLVKLIVLEKCDNFKLAKKYKKELVDLLAPVSLTKFLLPVAQYLLIAISVFIVYSDFGANIFLHDALLIAVATSLSALFSITPNNFGVQELLLGYSAHVTGLSVNDAISIAVLYRLAHLGSCSVILLLALGVPKDNAIK